MDSSDLAHGETQLFDIWAGSPSNHVWSRQMGEGRDINHIMLALPSSLEELIDVR